MLQLKNTTFGYVCSQSYDSFSGGDEKKCNSDDTATEGIVVVAAWLCGNSFLHNPPWCTVYDGGGGTQEETINEIEFSGLIL